MKNNANIEFALVAINTEEFAKFEENFRENAKINHNFNFGVGFNLNDEDKLVEWNFEIQASIEEKIILKGKFNFTFKISNSSWSNLEDSDKVIMPKALLAHFAMLAVGSIRGILFEKLSKGDSPLSKYILPLLNVSEVIKDDIELEISK